MKKLTLICVVVLLAGCSNNKPITISNTKPESVEKIVEPAPMAKSRSEPVFYNGKTYQLDFGKNVSGQFDVAVNGMNAKQQKDAEAISTSTLRYYACKESQSSKLSSKPVYVAGQWRMVVACV